MLCRGLDGAPTLVHVGGRAFLCLWLGYDDGSASTGTDLDIYSSYSPDGGVTWEDYVLVSDYGDEDGYSENLPSVTVSNDGSLVFATWRLDLGTEHDIIGVTSNDGGRTWGQAVCLDLILNILALGLFDLNRHNLVF